MWDIDPCLQKSVISPHHFKNPGYATARTHEPLSLKIFLIKKIISHDEIAAFYKISLKK